MAKKKNKYTPIRKPKREGSNNVTLAIDTKASEKKKAMVQLANDELTADIMTKAIHSPLAQEGLDQLGVENMTRLFKYGSDTFGSYYHKGHTSAKDFETYGHVGEKRFKEPGYESVVIATKDIPKGGNKNVPSQFRTVATHEYGHKSLDSNKELDSFQREGILTRQDMRDSDPKERKIAKDYFDYHYDKGQDEKADRMLDRAQAAAKKRLIKKGIYIKPPKRNK